jgi:hypothetical protein
MVDFNNITVNVLLFIIVIFIFNIINNMFCGTNNDFDLEYFTNTNTKSCMDGYELKGKVCIETCKPGYKDIGQFCTSDVISYEKKNNYEDCKTDYYEKDLECIRYESVLPRIIEDCPSNYNENEQYCISKPDIYSKSIYENCPENYVDNGSECTKNIISYKREYKKCPTDYDESDKLCKRKPDSYQKKIINLDICKDGYDDNGTQCIKNANIYRKKTYNL